MLIEVFLISILLLVIAVLGFGVKLLFDKDAELPKSSCNSIGKTNGSSSCACGGHSCTQNI